MHRRRLLARRQHIRPPHVPNAQSREIPLATIRHGVFIHSEQAQIELRQQTERAPADRVHRQLSHARGAVGVGVGHLGQAQVGRSGHLRQRFFRVLLTSIG